MLTKKSLKYKSEFVMSSLFLCRKKRMILCFCLDMFTKYCTSYNYFFLTDQRPLSALGVFLKAWIFPGNLKSVLQDPIYKYPRFDRKCLLKRVPEFDDILVKIYTLHM